MIAANVAEAYAFCRGVAKREAKNFYWSFRVLPKAKSDAMCAVYAFMRRADDIADDETMPVAQRRVVMAEWLAAWRLVRETGAGDDPVFVALGDAQRRFGIGDELLEDLVRGTSMDLEEGQGAAGGAVKLGDGLEGYETFEDLYRYCYLVASVVGLVCIKIFGYRDARAELLAERTGVAFQLTNILRDVKEDVERGRVYLPQSLLGEFQVSNGDVVALAGGREMRPNDRAMISALSVQAWEYYASARELLPLIDKDSRAALWVLVEIYSRLLQKIDARHGDVFSKRVSVPTGEKMMALVRGAGMAARNRI
ncbi:phytoene/squalene synthase family protein [Granulicella tundricola]|uniref:Phytoene synthase n=1 Tax=Granulicella tundricola (strain ATCC BAA-1859 / DSM 23138 / MP5ACTX9) TaxID=1198114 RepID=E8WY66_GRATM|nr:phytoene/squalene synthase family protein [Granulicella tundricola]ADW68693.1 Phytoene synthase [Granulicella tundricola MP5ACTX9]